VIDEYDTNVSNMSEEDRRKFILEIKNNKNCWHKPNERQEITYEELDAIKDKKLYDNEEYKMGFNQYFSQVEKSETITNYLWYIIINQFENKKYNFIINGVPNKDLHTPEMVFGESCMDKARTKLNPRRSIRNRSEDSEDRSEDGSNKRSRK